MAARPVFLLGGGLVSTLGRGPQTHARALARTEPATRASRVRVGARDLMFHFATAPSTQGFSLLHMMQAAVSDALNEARLSTAAVSRMAVFVGSTSLDVPLHEAAYLAHDDHSMRPSVIKPGYANLAQDIARRCSINGPRYTLNTACSSSANAALYARAMLVRGRIEHALVIGAEGYNRLSLLGFSSLMLLTRDAYRPFDRARDGLILGEGVGAMVLGLQPRTGDSRPFALTGAASACDPSSPTGSQADRVAGVMREAIADAGLEPGSVAAIKAHGTGTPSNDLAEGQALRQVFGATLPPVTSMKSRFGHTLGACGAIEMLGMIACWREGFLPPTAGFSESDEAIGVSPETRLRTLPGGHVLCNFFGFGGNNTSLVLSAP